MRLQDTYPIIVTEATAACKDLYTRHLGFEAVFESSWFILLSNTQGHPFSLALMTPDHPSNPPGPEVFSGKGMCLEFQVEDATAEYARLQSVGVTITYPLKDEAWGERRFGFHDPAGTWIDIVERIEPAPGFWEPFLVG
jgi:catechol 2,3-dioxygenase-like lactoylglutathione lyase family enzyme